MVEKSDGAYVSSESSPVSVEASSDADTKGGSHSESEEEHTTGALAPGLEVRKTSSPTSPFRLSPQNLGEESKEWPSGKLTANRADREGDPGVGGGGSEATSTKQSYYSARDSMTALDREPSPD